MNVVVWCNQCEKEVGYTSAPAVSTAGFGATYVIVPDPCPCRLAAAREEGRRDATEEIADQLAEQAHPEPGPPY